MDIQLDPAVLDRLQKADELPTLPTLALRVARLVNDPHASMQDLVQIIRTDPAVTSKILRVANSAYYGMQRKIESLNMALVILGMKEIHHLVNTISVFQAFPKGYLPGNFEYKKFWIHSAGVGEAAQLLSNRLGFFEKGAIFTGGLLHDMGKIILARFFTDEFFECIEIANRREIELRKAEDYIIGTNHALIGAWLAEKWQLPKILVEIVLHHHTYDQATGFPAEVTLIHLANILCNQKGMPFINSGKNQKLKDEKIWEILFRMKPSLAKSPIDQFLDETVREIDKIRDLVNIMLEDDV